jgi:hypothetical protein
VIRVGSWTPSCRDCGAPVGALCADTCPSALAVEHEAIVVELENAPEACCPTPEYAAAVLCGCGGPVRQAVAS